MSKSEYFESIEEMEEAKLRLIRLLTSEEKSATKIITQGESLISITVESAMDIEDKVRKAFGNYYRE
ncbi:hypothetical protein [Paraglaciecola sp. L3A3]|uniref:hypothetical protein n=1 Tax=Paraglaciecola sp. L3A3 TaxID=2686358 RepID=UPI00131A8F06|nr:hypothetical protein [Paraglaciecola sp. L3A3]